MPLLPSKSRAPQHAKVKILEPYLLDKQIGFILRQVSQRHATIFANPMIEGLTPTQWAVVAKLTESGPLSQNLLGRRTAMDGATIKGVVDRLLLRGFILTTPSQDDARLLLIQLSEEGEALASRAIALAREISSTTLSPLNLAEQQTLLRLMSKLR